MAVQLKEHQREAVDALENGNILAGDVGSGKTIASLAYYVENESPKDLYVFTTAKKRDELDWEDEAALYGISRHRESTLHGTINVDSWNNIQKYIDIKDAFFIFDEQRLVGSGAWVKAFLKIVKSNRWILLSATPGDSWLDYIPVFVANGYFKNRTLFIDEHVVYDNFSKFPKVKRFVGTSKLERLRRRIVVDMPFERSTVRHEKHCIVEHDEEMFRRILKDRWNVYDEFPVKDIAELFRLMRRCVNENPARIEEVINIHNKHPRLIIFYNFNYELEMLRELGEKLWVEMAEWNGHKHQPVPSGDSWIYLVQYTAGAEGWNCVTTDATIFFSLNYSYKLFEQAKGRIDRLNTPFKDLYYYVIKTNSQIDHAIWRALKVKQSFQEPKDLTKLDVS